MPRPQRVQRPKITSKQTVLAFGTFDLLHPGHKYYLERAKAYGDELVVVVARDETVRQLKGHYPIRDEATRLEAVARLKPVTRAQLGHPKSYYQVLDDLRPDTIALGYDQKYLVRGLRRELGKRRLRTRVVRIGAYRPEEYKTTLLIKQLAERFAKEPKLKKTDDPEEAGPDA